MRFIDPLTEQQMFKTAGLQPGMHIAQQLQNLQKQALSNKYFPQLSQARLNLLQQQVPLAQAQAGLTEARAAALPQQIQVALQNASTRQRMSKLSGPRTRLYGLMRMMENPAFIAQASAKTPEGRRLTGQINETFKNIIQQLRTKYAAPTEAQPDFLTPSGAPVVPQVGALSQPVPQDGTVPPAAHHTVDDAVVNDMQTAMRDQGLRKRVPNKILELRYFDSSIENMLQDLKPDMAPITKYAGAWGKSKLSWQKFAASIGIDPDNKDYQTVNSFLKVKVPAIGNEFRRAFGAQASDKESKMVRNLVNPIYVSSNPMAAVAQMNTLAAILRSNAKALHKTPSEIASQEEQRIAHPLVFGKRAPLTLQEQAKAEIARRRGEEK